MSLVQLNADYLRKELDVQHSLVLLSVEQNQFPLPLDPTFESVAGVHPLVFSLDGLASSVVRLGYLRAHHAFVLLRHEGLPSDQGHDVRSELHLYE